MKPCEVPQQEMDLPEQGVVSQPVPSVAWSSGDAGREAYTGTAKPCDRASAGMAPAGLGAPPAFLGRPRATTIRLCSGSRSENPKIKRPEHWHRALGCERGVRVSQVSCHAPVTGRPAFSRGLTRGVDRTPPARGGVVVWGW